MKQLTYCLYSRGNVVKQMYAYNSNTEDRVFCRVERIFETGHLFIHFYLKKTSGFSYKRGAHHPQYHFEDIHSTYDKKGRVVGKVITYSVSPKYQMFGAAYLPIQCVINDIFRDNINLYI